jgi:hypothetical protein
MKWHIALWIGLLCCVCSTQARARDVRVALLIAHEQGWKEDPMLRYVIKGDLMPLAAVLRRIGFRVKLLKNPGPKEVRKALKWVQQRVGKQPKVSTFLFYYSGHADRHQLHLGKRTKHPVTYKSLVSFLRGLPVQRRIALLDACFSGEIVRHFGSLGAYKKLVRKGARGIRPLDLTRAFPNQGQQTGLQILSSSLDYSWESRQYKASVFTFHLLKGLKGSADRDRDGRISVGELFNFVSDSMAKEIRQKPVLFGMVKRTQTYALAPAYHSRLLIDSSVLGTIRVSVANFFWSRRKKRRRPVRLAVVHGYGSVDVEHKGRCWRQRIYLPKGREARLRNQWKSISCRRAARIPKGSISLPSRVYVPPPVEREWSLALAGGVLGSGALGSGMFPGGAVSLWHRFGGLQLGVWGTSLPFETLSRDQIAIDARLIGGMTWKWSNIALSLFTGVYAGALMLWQDVNLEPRNALMFQAGALLKPTFWLTSRWGIELSVDAQLLVGRVGGQLQPFFGWNATLGLRFLL